MLQVARECSGRDPTDLQLSSYGEFCLFASELKQCYQNQSPKAVPVPKAVHETNQIPLSCVLDKNMSKSTPQCQVFLGGSCNPTTWRQDVAIPMLKTNGISYYNPQVSHWEEALIEAENQAKKNASVLFYVFDSSTRNVASMIETAFMAGSRRKLVAVVDSYSGPGQIITGEPISQSEYDELSSGLVVVHDLLESQGIPVFSDMDRALNCTVKIVRENIWPQDLDVEEKVLPSKYPQKQFREKLKRLHEAFLSMNSNRITLPEANAVFKIVTNRDLSTEEVKAIVSHKKGLNNQDLNTPDSDIQLSFQEFCCIVAEFESQQSETRRLWQLLTQSVLSPLQKLVDWVMPRCSRMTNGQEMHDVYLGGFVGAQIRWRESSFIPALRKHKLTYCVPSFASQAAKDEDFRLLSDEISCLESCRVQLFTITSKTRDVSQMTLAAHCIGLGKKVVLCIETITQGTSIDGEQLSAAAIKDYNRGRSYLRDIANKQNIPVFSEIDEAVQCVLQMCSKSSCDSR